MLELRIKHGLPVPQIPHRPGPNSSSDQAGSHPPELTGPKNETNEAKRRSRGGGEEQ
uniref:Uncharacterized protein n=1 Tax=Arundo donax TaxID=35708 RepID=A0A0A9ML71_ARUDO